MATTTKTTNKAHANGKQLEELVALIEIALSPDLHVTLNDKLYDESGSQVAELDVVVEGKIGSTRINWLIECRDRRGRAPISWIEQLVARRDRLRFNKVTAVSTAGFTRAAIKYAQAQGIELREVKAISADAFSDLLATEHLVRRTNAAGLLATQLVFNQEEENDRQAAISRFIAAQAGDGRFLRSTKSGEHLSALEAFRACVFANEAGDLFEGLEPAGPVRRIKLHAQFVDPDDHYVICTDSGAVRVEELVFLCELSVRDAVVPVSFTGEYCAVEDGAPFSQIVTFDVQDGLYLEMHRLAGTGEMHVIVRHIQAGAARWSSPLIEQRSSSKKPR